MIRIKGVYWTEYTNNDIMIIIMMSESKETMGRLDKPQLNTYLEKLYKIISTEVANTFLTMYWLVILQIILGSTLMVLPSR